MLKPPACSWRSLSFFLMLSCSVAPAWSAGAQKDWPEHAGDSDETNFSQLSQINAHNIGKLGLAWYLDLPDETTLESTPLEIKSVLYFSGTYGKVYAVDAVDGSVLWTHDPQFWKDNPRLMRAQFAASRGVAYAEGRIFLATFDGRLQALEATTGKLLWSADTTPRDSFYYISSAPRVFGHNVIIGNGGGDIGIRGFVTAYDQRSGKQVWRFYTVPGTPEENRGNTALENAAKTWAGEFWKLGTGGSVWDNITYDSKYNRIYIGTGNPGPTDADKRSPGGGDNLYTDAIVALDADTGQYRWHYQLNPRDTWGYDSTQQMTLAELLIDGHRRDVLMQAPKNGFFYIIDRRTGKLISAEKIGKVTWAERIDVKTGRPIEGANMRYQNGDAVLWPNPAGTHSWQSQSYDRATGLMYIPYMQAGVHYYTGEAKPGDLNDFGTSIGTVIASPEDGKGALLAWDPISQKPRWKAQHGTLFNGGVLSTAGSVVFQGTADGDFLAYDAQTGQELWRTYAGFGIIAAPMTYEANGRQYVSILVGYGAIAGAAGEVMDVGWKWGAPHRLLTFAIGGSAQLPPAPPKDKTIHAADDPNLTFSETDAQAGRDLSMQCILCHGRDLNPAGGAAPDLRESSIPLNADAFWSVVHDGTLISKGMPQFDDLTARQATQLRAYIRATARAAMAKQRADDEPRSH